MSDKSPVFGFLMAAAIGVALTCYSVSIALSINVTATEHRATLMLCMSMAIFLSCLVLFNFYLAFAFKFGRVDQVSGSKNSATLHRDSTVVKQAQKISWCWSPSGVNEDIPAAHRNVIFIIGWRPWVCGRNCFLH
jgi:hypothetical protein